MGTEQCFPKSSITSCEISLETSSAGWGTPSFPLTSAPETLSQLLAPGGLTQRGSAWPSQAQQLFLQHPALWDHSPVGNKSGRGEKAMWDYSCGCPRAPGFVWGLWGFFFCCCFLSSAASGWNQPTMEGGWPWKREFEAGLGLVTAQEGKFSPGWRGCSISILHPCRTWGKHGKFPAALFIRQK